MLQKADIDLKKLPAGKRDAVMGESTGGATIFGVSGGVMEAALRFAYQDPGQKTAGKLGFQGPSGIKRQSRRARSLSPAPR